MDPCGAAAWNITLAHQSDVNSIDYSHTPSLAPSSRSLALNGRARKWQLRVTSLSTPLLWGMAWKNALPNDSPLTCCCAKMLFLSCLGYGGSFFVCPTQLWKFKSALLCCVALSGAASITPFKITALVYSTWNCSIFFIADVVTALIKHSQWELFIVKIKFGLEGNWKSNMLIC